MFPGRVQVIQDLFVPPDDRIRSVLGDAKTIASVGCSDKPHRDSHAIAAYLQRHG